MLKIIIAGLVLFVLVGITAASCNPGNGNTGQSQIKVVSEKLTDGTSGQAVLLVTIENTGTVTAELAEVSVKFYGAGRKLLDSKSESIMNLKSGETWDFSISCNSTRNKIANWETTTTAGGSK
jgi:hypothetical protein